jgi:hypothetical protein
MSLQPHKHPSAAAIACAVGRHLGNGLLVLCPVPGPVQAQHLQRLVLASFPAARGVAEIKLGNTARPA